MTIYQKPPVEPTSTYTTEISYSYVTEFFSALQLLADSRHHAFAADFAQKVYQHLSTDLLNSLTLLATFPYQGLEFAEFYMKGSVAHDFDACMTYMDGLSHLDYLLILFDGIVPEEAVTQLYTEKLSPDELVVKFPDLAPINLPMVHKTFLETTVFRKEMHRLFYALHENTDFTKGIQHALKQCEPAVEALKIACLGTEPQTLVHSLIHKKWPLPDADHYWFIPSYFVSPHHTLMIKGRSLGILYDARLNTETLQSVGTKISSDLQALTDKTRIEILRNLISKPTYNRILSATLNLSTATISHHLDILKKAGLIVEKPYKKMKIYSANHEAIEALMKSTTDYLYNR